MWTYTKCTSKDREEKLNKLTEAFAREKDCSRYLSEVQKFINSTQTTIVLLQDVEDNVLIEMDYVPVNDYVFHVVNIEENGIKKQGLPCMTIKQAVSQFMAEIQDGNRFHTKEEVFMPTIFLSHTSIDKPFVEKLARDLQRLGISVWYDKYEIKVGESLSGGRYG